MKLTLLANNQIIQSEFVDAFGSFCKKNYLTLDKINQDNLDKKEINKFFAQQRNICIQFDRKKDISFYKNVANVLFLQDYCLLPDKKFTFDANGYGLYSNFVAHKLNRRIYHTQDHEYTKDFYRSHGYEFDVENLTSNSLFIYLDCLQDETNLLDVCAKHLPKNIQVTLVGSTNNKQDIENYYEKYKNQFADCKMLCDNIDCEVLRGCEAIILRNNDICYKAMAMGIKVITFDFGFYTGTPTILECHSRAWMLKHCLSFVPDKNAIYNIFCALHDYCIDKNTNQYNFIYNNQLITWLARMFV